MEDRLLSYYERELTFIREMGVEFARKYPKIAGRLLLEPDKCEDPHTERLIEAFAFISGRIHKKIEDDFPEITESLLSILYPHYVSPIPSMSVVRFEPAKQTIPAAGYTIKRNSALYSRPVGGVPCQFTTAYPVTLWPIEVVSASLRDPKRLVRDAQQSIVIEMKTFHNLSLSGLDLGRLRFFLNGQGQHVYHLYELLFNNVCHVECELSRDGAVHTLALPEDSIRAVGFDAEEGMIPYPEHSFPGYLQLFEYFCFPEKFLFFDLVGLDRLKRQKAAGDSLTLTLYLNRVAKPNLLIGKDTFCLNATPIANIFTRVAEPVRVEHYRTEYPVIPDVRRPGATEVFSVDSVTASVTGSSERGVEFRPFYSLMRHLDDAATQGVFWQVHREASRKNGDTTFARMPSIHTTWTNAARRVRP